MDFSMLADLHLAYKTFHVSDTIAPDDEMWRAGKEWYFGVGESALRAVLIALAPSHLNAVSTILDLPCGHGRVARHLRGAFPNAQMSFCDLDRSGVDFCRSTFGGKGIYSRPDLLEVPLESYDLIWVGSLFTHVDRDRTIAWLAFLCSHLNSDGVIVATFHGRWSREVQKRVPMISDDRWNDILLQCDHNGYGYAAYPNYGDGSFGISLSTPSHLTAIASEIPGVRILGYTERGWADNHDVLVLGKTDRLKPWP